MSTFSYTNTAFHYAGRWVDHGSAMGCAWQAGQVRFKVSGTSVLTINAVVSGTVYCVVNVDGGQSQLATFPGTSGAQSISFSISGAGEHTVVAKLFGLPDGQFNQSLYARFTGVTLSDGATLSAWPAGPISLQMVGDSWMASQNDWPHLLPSSRYSIYPVAFGGATAGTLNARYNYTSSGVTAPADPTVQGVVVNAGVNDTYGGVSTADFKANMAALVDKIRARQAAAKIIILGSPRNVSAGKAYNQYDTVNAEVAAARANVVFLPVPNATADALSWNGDQAHINYTGGLVTFAQWVDAQIYPLFAPAGDSVWLRTAAGSTQISTTPGAPSGAADSVAIRIPGGYLSVDFQPVVGAAPTDVLLLRTPGGLLRAL